MMRCEITHYITRPGSRSVPATSFEEAERRALLFAQVDGLGRIWTVEEAGSGEAIADYQRDDGAGRAVRIGYHG